jgi:hypothetical protein
VEVFCETVVVFLKKVEVSARQVTADGSTLLPNGKKPLPIGFKTPPDADISRRTAPVFNFSLFMKLLSSHSAIFLLQ